MLATDLENLDAGATGTSKINLTGNASANTLTGNAADNVLDGGLGADTLIGGAGNDTYGVDNAGDVVTEKLNEGTDLVNVNIATAGLTYMLSDYVENATLINTVAFNLTGNNLDNVLTGNATENTLAGKDGNDMLGGGAGADTLDGGAGNDTMDGGTGADSLTGGAGNDNFSFSTALISNTDTITDFTSGQDIIELSKTIFSTLGVAGSLNPDFFHSGTGSAAVAQDANDHIIYDNLTGALYYDADGIGGAEKVQFVTLVGIPDMTSSDFIVGA